MPFVTAAILGGSALAAGALGAHAAGKAASTQADAATTAAALAHDSAQQSLNFDKSQYANSQAELAPYYASGVSANTNLANLLGVLPASAQTSPIFDPAAAAQATLAGPARPGTKPSYMSTADWNALGKYQQIALTQSGADTSLGVKQSGARPDDISAATWAAIPQAQKDALMKVGTPFTPAGPAAGQPGGPNTLSSLVNPSLGASGSLLQPFGETWQAPTAVTEQNDPGFQFRLDQGQKALERSAAAKGNLLTGGTLADENANAQGIASQEYGNVYNRALNDYTTRYNQFEQHNNDIYNRLAALSGTGQTAANQLANNGQQFASSAGNILQNGAQQEGQQINNAAAATASGYVGGANAWGGALSGGANSLLNLQLLSQLNGYGQPSDPGGR